MYFNLGNIAKKLTGSLCSLSVKLINNSKIKNKNFGWILQFLKL